MAEKEAPISREAGASANAAHGVERARSRRRPSRAQAFIARWRNYGVAAFIALMVLGGVFGILFPFRPSTSDVEKRTLEPFPEVTLAAFLDGSYFTELSLWFSDTYPLREPLVALNQALSGLKGIQPSTQMVGGNVKADELPSEGSVGPATPVMLEERTEVEAPNERVRDADIQDSIMGGLYVEGDAVYSLYYYSSYAVSTYAQAINTAQARLNGEATIYSIIIPNNSGAKLDERTLELLGGSDQQQAIKYFYSLMDPSVRTVETYDALRAHRDEYTYFRTDHHWTQLGAYYVYRAFCEKKGIEPIDLSAWEEVANGPFLGSYYSELQLSQLAANPDTVYAHVPPYGNAMTWWDEWGTEYDSEILFDVEYYDEANQYLCFMDGNQPLARIENPTVTDGSSCLVVVESYGPPCVTLLAANYQTVWVMDFRTTVEDIPAFVFANGIQDVIFLNNVAIAGTDTAADTLLAAVS